MDLLIIGIMITSFIIAVITVIILRRNMKDFIAIKTLKISTNMCSNLNTCIFLWMNEM